MAAMVGSVLSILYITQKNRNQMGIMMCSQPCYGGYDVLSVEVCSVGELAHFFHEELQTRPEKITEL